ncbi:MAG TPA: twin-arginine translocase TatA/TatE family subunit [Planctomycetota bacterium]
MVLAWISSGEILLAAVVGLLIFGGRLPEVLKDAGRAFYRIRRSLNDLRRETGLDRTLRELEWESRKIRDEVKFDPGIDTGIHDALADTDAALRDSGGLPMPTVSDHHGNSDQPPASAGDPGPGSAANRDEPEGERKRQVVDPTPQDLGERPPSDH